MALVTGDSLNSKDFFTSGQPSAQGSSFDLTIGHIFDDKGKKVEGPFTLKPGHMVQVVSSEVFGLSDSVTGHVTYKTTLTKRGIWALTVGIVDPGWNGPIATTLLNFSKVDHAVAEGDAFLRVSFFQHAPISPDKLRRAPPLKDYLVEIQKAAASMFPPTFLNSEKIAEAAGANVLSRIRSEALVWVAGIALLFTILQQTKPDRPIIEVLKKDIDTLRSQMDFMQTKLLKFEANSQAPPPSTRRR